MRLATLGLDRETPTVVVIGAGASRGASCVSTGGVKPPLDDDFFSQAQRLPAEHLNGRDRELLSFIRREFGQGDLPTLEVFFTQVAAVDRFHRDFNIRGRPSGQFARQLDALRDLIPRVFGAALNGKDCVWHERLAAALRARDAIMSFNYDTLMDRALREVGGKRWNPSVGYGFQMGHGTATWSPPPSPGSPFKKPVQLLKPHGSLNWSIDSDQNTAQLVDEYSPDAANSIVPPTWDKSDVTNWPWHEVWRSARNVLGLARLLVVIGYSVPVTDQMSQALLRADVTRLDGLVVVNPDSSARRRVIDTMSSALDHRTAVLELSTLEEFAHHLPEAPRETGIRSLQDQLNNLRKRVTELTTQMETLIGTQEDFDVDLRDELNNIVWRVEELADDVTGQVNGLRSELQDLDSRLDSLVR